MTSLDLIYNDLKNRYGTAEQIITMFQDFDRDYIMYQNVYDEMNFNDWLNTTTPAYKKYYWDFYNALPIGSEDKDTLDIFRCFDAAFYLSEFI